MSYTLECPYCDAELADPDDCHEPTDYEHECPECGKSFKFEVEYERTYHAYKADCLNDGEHKWAQRVGAPAAYFVGKFRCEVCGEHQDRAPAQGAETPCPACSPGSKP